jgi:hypothetical protein
MLPLIDRIRTKLFYRPDRPMDRWSDMHRDAEVRFVRFRYVNGVMAAKAAAYVTEYSLGPPTSSTWRTAKPREGRDRDPLPLGPQWPLHRHACGSGEVSGQRGASSTSIRAWANCSLSDGVIASWLLQSTRTRSGW